jgi:hypothetical protein
MDEELKASLRPRPVALEVPMDLIAGRAKQLRVRTRLQWGGGAVAAVVLVIALWTATMGSPLHHSVEIDHAPKTHLIKHASKTKRGAPPHDAIRPTRVATPNTTRPARQTTAAASNLPVMSVNPVDTGATTTTIEHRAAPTRPAQPTVTTTATTVPDPYPAQITRVRLTFVVDDAGLHGPTTCACANEEIEILFLDQRVSTKYTSAQAYLTSDVADPTEVDAWAWTPSQTDLPIPYVLPGDYHLNASVVADELGALTLHITG